MNDKEALCTFIQQTGYLYSAAERQTPGLVKAYHTPTPAASAMRTVPH